MGVCTTDTNIRKGGNPKNGNGKSKIIMDPKIEEPTKEPSNNIEIIKDGKDPYKKDDNISKKFINEIGITSNPDELASDKSNKKVNDKNINYNIIYRNEKESQVRVSNNKSEPNQENNSSQTPEKKSNYKDNKNLNKENLNKYYEKLDINKDYYLICPSCKLYITIVESIEYDSILNDYKFKYKCFCNEVRENYLNSIIRDEKPICNNHNNVINFICQDCSTQICEECKNNNHNIHNIKNIINYEVIPESIMNNISEKKDIFKGFVIFEKIFKFYKTYPTITKLQDNKPGENENNQNDDKLKDKSHNKPEDPENEKNEEQKLNNSRKNSNHFSDRISTKNENNSINKSENEAQKKPGDNDDLKDNTILKNEYKREEGKNINNLNGEYNIPKILNKSEKNIINNNINNAGKENMKNDCLNKVGNKNIINNEDDLNFNNINTMPNIDNPQEKETKQEIKIINDPINFINSQNEISIRNKSNNENKPEKKDINIILQNKEVNYFERAVNSGKPEENNLNINQENNFNNNIENNKNINYNINNNINSNNSNNTKKNFQIFNISNNDIVNQFIENSPNDFINKEKNINNCKNIIKDDDNINIKNHNDIFDSINLNKNKVLKQYKNTKTLIGHKAQIVSLIQLSSGYICTGSYDFSVKIWDITKDEKEPLITTKYSIGFVLCLLELKPNELLAGNIIQ